MPSRSRPTNHMAGDSLPMLAFCNKSRQAREYNLPRSYTRHMSYSISEYMPDANFHTGTCLRAPMSVNTFSQSVPFPSNIHSSVKSLQDLRVRLRLPHRNAVQQQQD